MWTPIPSPIILSFLFSFFSLLLLHLFIHQATVCVCTCMKSFVQNYIDKGLKKCGFISVCTLSSECIVQFSELSQAVFSVSLSRQEVSLKNIDSGGGEQVLRSCLCYVVILTVSTLKLSSASQLQNAD